MNLHRGQGLELLWRDSLQCPTEEEYISMVNNSTQCSRLEELNPYLVHRNGRLVSCGGEAHDGMLHAKH